MLHAIIAGDLVASTDLTTAQKVHLESLYSELEQDLKREFEVFTRFTRGDFIESYIPKIEDSLRVLLCIKCFFKSLSDNLKNIDSDSADNSSLFHQHGIRLALSIDKLDRLRVEEGVIDGQAIYNAGRQIESQKTHNRNKVSIKNTLFFESPWDDFTASTSTIFHLLHEVISRATAKQCEVMYLRLLGADERIIVELLGVTQSTVNRHSTNGGWHAIEKTLDWFPQAVKKYIT